MYCWYFSKHDTILWVIAPTLKLGEHKSPNPFMLLFCFFVVDNLCTVSYAWTQKPSFRMITYKARNTLFCIYFEFEALWNTHFFNRRRKMFKRFVWFGHKCLFRLCCYLSSANYDFDVIYYSNSFCLHKTHKHRIFITRKKYIWHINGKTYERNLIMVFFFSKWKTFIIFLNFSTAFSNHECFEQKKSLVEILVNIL